MMRKAFRSKLKSIFLLWAVTSRDFCVKGHPALEGLGMHITQGTKVIDAAAQADKLANNLQSVNAVNRIGDGIKLKTSTYLPGLRAGSGDTKIVDTTKANMKDMEEDPLKPTSNNEVPYEDVRYYGVVDLDPIFKSHKLFDWNMKFLNPAQVRKLPPHDMIRYIAERDPESAKEAMKLYKSGQEYDQVAEKVVSVAMSGKDANKNVDPVLEAMEARKAKDGKSKADAKRLSRLSYIYSKLNKSPSPDLQQAVQKLEVAHASYAKLYQDFFIRIIKPISRDQLAPEEVLKLTDKQYARKAALYDKDANPKYGQWLKEENTLRELVTSTRSKLSPKFIQQSEQVLKSKINDRFLKLMEDAKLKGEPIDETSIREAAEREVVKTEAKHSEYPEFQQVAGEIERLEKNAMKAKKMALGSADKFYKGQKVLKSSELRYKPRWSLTKVFQRLGFKNWSLREFLKKMFPWFFRRGRYERKNNKAATTV